MAKKVVRCVLRNNEPIFDSECPVRTNQLKPSNKCLPCLIHNPLQLAPKPKAKKSVEPTPEPIVAKAQLFNDPAREIGPALKLEYDMASNPEIKIERERYNQAHIEAYRETHKEGHEPPPLIWSDSVTGFQQAFKTHYEKDRNPIHLMMAFNDAVEYNIPIPEWVSNKLYNAFDKFIKNDAASLDVLLGCKPHGRDTVKARFKTRDRNVFLMTRLDMLIRLGLTVKDAIQVVQEHSQQQGASTPTREKIRTMYYSGWKKELESIHVYPQHWIEDILRHASEPVRQIFLKLCHLKAG